MLLNWSRCSKSASVCGSPLRLFVSTSFRWATVGSAPATCLPNHQRPRRRAKSQKRASGAKKGALKGEIVLKYLDESGISLCLPPSYTWTYKGQKHQHQVRSRWGKQGRINLIATLVLQGETEWLEYKILEGSCRSGEVTGYLEHLAERAEQEGKAVVVVLDRASFHRAEALQEERPK